MDILLNRIKKIKFSLLTLIFLLFFCIPLKAEKLLVNKFTNAPVIDGIIDGDWDTKPWVPIKNIIISPLSEDDLSAQFKAGWIDNTLFLLFKVKDNMLTYGFDRIFLYLDLENDNKDAFELDWNDYQITLYQGGDEYEVTKLSTNEVINTPIEIKQVFNEQDGDYLTEVAINTNNLDSIQIGESSRFRFQAEICDHDGAFQNESYIYWSKFDVNNTPGYIMYPVNYGTFTLITVGEPVLIELKKEDITNNQTDNGSIDLTIVSGTPPFNIAWSNGETTEDVQNLAEGKYIVTVTDSKGLQAIDSAEINNISSQIVYEFDTTPVIDGNIEEVWDSNPFLNITRPLWNTVIPDTNDLKGKFKLGWYGSYLYVLLVVADDILYSVNPEENLGAELLVNDAYLIYLDLGNEKSIKKYDANDYWLIFDWGMADKIWGRTINGYNSSAGSQNFFPPYEMAQKHDISNNIFTMELAINVMEWNRPDSLEDASSIGFDIEILDADDGVRESHLNWYGDGQAWDDPSQMGTIGLGTFMLKSGSGPTNVIDNELRGKNEMVTVYPTIANDKITIESEIDLSVAEIYNMTGVKVLSGEINGRYGRIDISHLNSGIYIIKTCTDSGTYLSSRKIFVIR